MEKSKLLAKALVKLAEREPQKIADDLRLVEKSFDYKLLALMSNPLLTPDKRKDVTAKIFGQKISEESLRFVQILIDANELANLRKIRRIYERILTRQKTIAKVEIVTAAPIPSQSLERLTNELQEKLKRNLTIKQKVDPEVIGGILIKIGDNCYDNTLRRRVDELCQTLS